MNNICLLDCTLRDGGYYNNWDFDIHLVQKYLQTMSEIPVNYVEIGFRFFNKSEYYGPYAYSTDDFIKKLDVPKTLKIGVMLNLKDIISSPYSIQETLDLLFVDSSQSPVDLVRVAANFADLLKAKDTLKILKEKGYEVGLNIMQVNSAPKEYLKEAIYVIEGWKSVDVLYFADSLGNMQTEDISDVYTILKDNWTGPIGIHAHNNMGQADQNSLFASKLGVDWIDATVSGMGRGAGNTRLENMLVNLNYTENTDYSVSTLLKLAIDNFGPLKSQYKWGENVFYYMSALYNIHPTYVQEMEIRGGYTSANKYKVLQSLIKDGLQYSKHKLKNALMQDAITCEGEWDSTDWSEGRDVLLIGSGPSTKKVKEEIKSFIERKKPIVISINYTDIIDESYIDIYACCHLTKIITQIDDLKNTSKKIMLPLNALPDNIIHEFKNKDTLNYGMKISEDKLEIDKSHTTIPYPLTFAYIVSSILNTKTTNIYLVGFNGYDINDHRNEEMEKIIELFKKMNNTKRFISLTPTIYNFEKDSIYNPHL